MSRLDEAFFLVAAILGVGSYRWPWGSTAGWLVIGIWALLKLLGVLTG